MRRAAWTLALALCACDADDADFDTEAPSGPSIYLEREESDRSRFTVRSHGIERIHGVAFRLAYDPGALRHEGARSSGVWPPDAVSLAREVEPGSLWVVWTIKGTHEGLGDVVLGTIELAHTPRTSSELSFVVERSAVFGPRGARIPNVSWIGGRLVSP